MARDIHMPLALDEVEVMPGRRALDVKAVKRLAESIERVGLRHPITVRKRGDEYVLVAGRHRLEAFRTLGEEHIPAIICAMSNADARMWEIAENLHRTELSVQERSEQIAEWVSLSDDKGGELRHLSSGRGNEGGISAAARDLNMPRTNVRQAVKIAGITDEAKAEAAAAGLDNNQSALLTIAKEAPAQQVHKVVQLRAAREDKLRIPHTWRDSFETLWLKGTDDDHAWAREFIDAPVMDQRFGR